MPICFLRRERKGTEADGWESGEELGGIGEREIVIRIYCLEKSIFNKRKEKN